EGDEVGVLFSELQLPLPIGEAGGGRFLAEDVLAGFECGDRLRAVRRIGAAEEDGVDVRPGEQSVEVGDVWHIRLADRRHRGPSLVPVPLMHRDELPLWVLHYSPSQGLTHPA